MTSVGSDPTLLPPPPAPPRRTDPALRRAQTLSEASLVMVGIGAGLVGLRALGVHGPPCALRSLTGVPCPGCGMTRLASAVARGDLGLALRTDAAGVALLAALLVLALTRVVRLARRESDPPAWLRSLVVPAVLIALGAVHWATTIVTGGLPSR